MTSILEVQGLSVAFDGSPVIKNLSFQVSAGSTLAVIGPNGVGKTVLFRALIGAIGYAGSIRWADGVKIGYVPQKLDLERNVPITGRDFLAARIALDRVPTTEIDRVLESVGLSAGTAEKRIGALSGGQFQRLLVAFALLGAPTVLLLDEPTAGIDGPGQERLTETIHDLQRERGLTVLLISHELTMVHRYATQVLCLSGGRPHFGPPTILTADLLRNLYGRSAGVHVHDA